MLLGVSKWLTRSRVYVVLTCGGVGRDGGQPLPLCRSNKPDLQAPAFLSAWTVNKLSLFV